MTGDEITTIKVYRKTKDRLDKLRIHRRESYEEIIEKMLNILNICRVNPESAQNKLKNIERQKKIIKS